MSGEVGHDIGTGISIIVADDDASLREVLTTHLENRGYTVHGAADGQEALSLAHKLTPTIAILDVMMPLVNGWDVARSLRNDPKTDGIRVLMLSGIGADVLGPNLAVLGGDLGLDKPFKLEELDQALEILLKR